MGDAALPIAFALLVWWLGTGLVLLMLRLPRRLHPLAFAVASLLLLPAAWGLAHSSAQPSGAAAHYCAFLCTVLLWAWQEIGFLMGYLTGPRRIAATPGLQGRARFHEATAAVWHHELALLALGAVVVAASWGQPNQTGLATFAVLWVMRLSAKLNLFLGVRNLYERFLPSHMVYLQTYFRRRPMNWLFPLAVMAAVLVAAPLWQAAARADSAGPSVGLYLVATLLSLAILEHLLLMLPLPGERLWNWALASAGSRR